MAEGNLRHISEVTTAEFRANGIGLAEELRMKDSIYGFPTPRSLRGSRRCPKCSHRSPTQMFFDRDAIRCRWGHITTGRELYLGL